MVFPTATQSNKPVSDQTATEKTASFSFIRASEGHANDSGNLSGYHRHAESEDNYGETQANDSKVPPAPVYVPVKVANGRKKRSGCCLAATFAAGVLVGLIIVALTVVFVHAFSGGKKSAWIEVEDEKKSHEHTVEDDKEPQSLQDLMRGMRPYVEHGNVFLEWMEIKEGIWTIDVPNYGHDMFGNIGYHYSIVVDFDYQLAAIKVGDSDNAFTSECFVAHAWDMGIPEREVVENFLEDVEQQLAMHVDKMQYYYFDPVPIEAGRNIGKAIGDFCAGVETFSLEPVVEEIKEQVEEILDMLGTSYEDMGELVDSMVESAVELTAGECEAMEDLMEATDEVLTYLPYLPSGTYEFTGKHGVAMSVNIRRRKRHERLLRQTLWRMLEGKDDEEDDHM